MKAGITMLVALWCLILSANACPYMGPYQKFLIVDRSTSLPLSETTVTLFYENKPSRHVVTDSTGCFFVRMLGGLPYRLVVKHDGYIGVEQQLMISEANDMVIDIRMSTVKKAKVRVREYERFARNPIVMINPEERVNQSISADPSFTSFACNMKHQNRKSEKVLAGGDKLFNEAVVYPNPIVSGSTVMVESKFDEQKVLVVYDMSGMEILRKEIVYHSIVETSSFKPGMYILKIIDSKNDDVVAHKLLVY